MFTYKPLYVTYSWRPTKMRQKVKNAPEKYQREMSEGHKYILFEYVFISASVQTKSDRHAMH